VVTSSAAFVQPLDRANERVTKKKFGTYITPQNSPVQPERFSGYHTGVDIEYGDGNDEVVVMSIADGLVVRSGWVSGYGGALAIKYNIEDKDYIVIYGHLNPDTLTKNGAYIKMGETIGVLGQGYSQETDNERRHLHFAIYTGKDINVRGYVQSQEELKKWLDPVEFFNDISKNRT